MMLNAVIALARKFYKLRIKKTYSKQHLHFRQVKNLPYKERRGKVFHLQK